MRWIETTIKKRRKRNPRRVRRDQLRKENRTQVISAKFTEAISGNIVNSTQGVLSLIRKLTQDTKPTGKEGEALVEVEEAEASSGVEALAEDPENSSTNRTINFIITQIRLLLVDRHQLFTLINRAMLLTVAQPCQHPEDIMANIITEMRPSIASLQWTPKLKILGNSWRRC